MATRLGSGILVMLSALGCSRGEPAPAPSPASAPERAPSPPPVTEPTWRAARVPEGLNLLLVTIDSLRADTSFGGYSRQTTPRLARLAEQGVVYERAYALSSYTSMSLAGLMTGKPPSTLRRDGRATSKFGVEETFLAEVVQRAGIRTLGVHGHVWFLGATGIRQGFDEWRVVPRITVHPARDGFVSDPTMTEMLIGALEQHRDERPAQRFFAWIHYMDPHFAYVRHERFRFSARELGAGTSPLSPPLSEHAQRRRDLYDGEVAHTDAELGKLLDWLAEQPFAERTAVIVTSDHGEAFGEHPGYHEHGFQLWDVVTRVPLVFVIPGVPAARIAERRSHLDLARTCLELLGLEPPAEMGGVSLVPELLGARPGPRDVVLDMPYTDQSPRRRAVLRGPHKVVVSEHARSPAVFDLERDPTEQTDLAPSHPALVAELLEVWREVDARYPDYPAPRRGRRDY